VGDVVREIGRTLGHYFVGQAKIAGILAGLYATGFAISGVPQWPVVALFGGAMQFVPLLGPPLTLLIAALAVALGGGGLYNYLGVLITFVVAQAVEGFYLTPTILGRHTRLSPWAVFFGALLGGMLFGPLGLLLAVPVLAVAMVLWRAARRAETQRGT
jgi:predicted PurR-regulated permease PerM